MTEFNLRDNKSPACCNCRHLALDLTWGMYLQCELHGEVNYTSDMGNSDDSFKEGHKYARFVCDDHEWEVENESNKSN